MFEFVTNVVADVSVLSIATGRDVETVDSIPTAQSAEQRRMPARVRQAHLVEAARRRGFFLVVDMSAELRVSEMTIRRDLIELERDGVLTRTRGGAVLAESAVQPAIDREEPAFDARLRKNQ